MGLIAPFALYFSAQASSEQPVAKPSAVNGKKIYTQYCLSCHQENGKGVPRLNPPLVKMDYVTGDKVRLINVLLKGFNEQVELDGDYYSNAMPAHDFLKDQQIADVLTYIRSNFENKASAVTAAEVKTVRAASAKK